MLAAGAAVRGEQAADARRGVLAERLREGGPEGRRRKQAPVAAVEGGLGEEDGGAGVEDGAERGQLVAAVARLLGGGGRQRGGAVLDLPTADGHLDLGALLDRLGAGDGLPDSVRKVQSLLVEAGPGLATALLAQDFVDRVLWFVAPKVMGEGTPAVGDLRTEMMADALAFAEIRWETVGPDILLRGHVRLAASASS